MGFQNVHPKAARFLIERQGTCKRLRTRPGYSRFLFINCFYSRRQVNTDKSNPGYIPLQQPETEPRSPTRVVVLGCGCWWNTKLENFSSWAIFLKNFPLMGIFMKLLMNKRQDSPNWLQNFRWNKTGHLANFRTSQTRRFHKSYDRAKRKWLGTNTVKFSVLFSMHSTYFPPLNAAKIVNLCAPLE